MFCHNINCLPPDCVLPFRIKCLKPLRRNLLVIEEPGACRVQILNAREGLAKIMHVVCMPLSPDAPVVLQNMCNLLGRATVRKFPTSRQPLLANVICTLCL
eukprot:TRINITY_DN29423_c0_g1_i1.p1 TRINITY_DN29423_c0_g1~~TRINITY_DN29423_c0_g1_i1.p1  ORF type:complete len:101 (+),score=1.84 TRINITY_DN29423_c0_g1_i1:1025-1327(+)